MASNGNAVASTRWLVARWQLIYYIFHSCLSSFLLGYNLICI
jgi:hypothetical protein